MCTEVTYRNLAGDFESLMCTEVTYRNLAGDFESFSFPRGSDIFYF